MSGALSVKERILETIRFAEHFDKNTKINLESMAYAFALKFLKEQDLNEIKEELRMTILGKMLVEDGKSEGKTEAALEFASKSIAKGFDNETISELTGLDTKEIEKIRENLQSLPRKGN